MTVGPVAASLETLRQSWADDSLYLYPDLVCLDVRDIAPTQRCADRIPISPVLRTTE